MSETLAQIDRYFDLLFAYGPFWVYMVIFLACFVENLFPPFPGDSFILAGGGLVAVGRLSILPLFVVIVVGGMSSVMLLYYFGRRYGRDYFVRKDYRFISAADIYRMESRFSHWGGLILVFSRFVVGARAALALVAGMGKYPAMRTLIFSTISYFLFAGILLYIGFVLVENIDAIGRIVRTYNIVIWPVLIAVVLIWILRRIMQLRKDRVS
jgi:membrane protein DedA with SNARE-associated domain